jgi:two-component system cell cycle sensor histidine kinase/response regulator CckA
MPPSSGKRETILLAEDQEYVRELMCSVLKQDGYNVLEAGDGEEAIRVSSQHNGKIDLLIADLFMPQMSGSFLARQLQSSRPNLKLLIVSGCRLEDGFDQHEFEYNKVFLAKPFLPKDLVKKVHEILEERVAATARG